jgi:hypothetical protein
VVEGKLTRAARSRRTIDGQHSNEYKAPAGIVVKKRKKRTKRSLRD